MILTLDTLALYCDEDGDCLPWKLGTNSARHPQARLDGKSQLVRRYVFAQLMHRTIRPGHVIRSRCGNSLCIAPGHLYQSTYAELIAQTYASGNRGGPVETARRRAAYVRTGKAKLSMEIAQQIRSEDRHMTHDACAAKWGVSRRAIQLLRQGHTWRDASMNLWDQR